MNSIPNNTEHLKNVNCGDIYFNFNPADLADIAQKCAAALEGMDYEFLAFRGMSGAVITPLLAIIVGKPFVVVRKPGEAHHSGTKVEGYKGRGEYIIVDDFVCTGSTVRAMWDALGMERCEGILEYKHLTDCGEGGYEKAIILPGTYRWPTPSAEW